MSKSASTAAQASQAALLQTAGQVLEPLLELLLSHGVKYAAMQELLKASLVKVAAQSLPQGQTERAQSRISVATGLRRPEIKRLMEEPELHPRAGRSIIADVFGRWTSHKRYRDARGRIMPLPRNASEGGDASFESLVWSIRRDVHPRAVLDDMLRLQMVKEDRQGRIKLNQVAFVPREDLAQMLHFLSHNVADHLASAVHNTLGRTPDFLEQSVLVEGLSEEGVRAIEQRARQEWARIFREMGDAMNQQLQEDKRLKRPASQQLQQLQQLRLGMYTHSKAWTDESAADARDQ
jgi:hypothetical protein